MAQNGFRTARYVPDRGLVRLVGLAVGAAAAVCAATWALATTTREGSAPWGSGPDWTATVVVLFVVAVGGRVAREVSGSRRAAVADGHQRDERLDRLERSVSALSSVNEPVLLRVGEVAAAVEQVGTRVDRSVARSRKALQTDLRQAEALVNLRAGFDVRAPLPMSRGWAASPDVLLTLVDLVLTRRPRLIVEAGSGLSTLWFCYALERLGAGRVVSLDHDPHFAELTRRRLQLHGLEHRAEIRVSQLQPVEHPELSAPQPWYSPEHVADLEKIDLLFVDGPPASTGPRSRMPALPILRERLSPGALIVLDDLVREDEQEILRRWQEMLPGSRSESLDHEKGTGLLFLP
ncbi:MAG: hypothetical protein QG608_468 [Actinomycetota bacterium]|nr:hypothetical protein [Actinomycetota bacterium]